MLSPHDGGKLDAGSGDIDPGLAAVRRMRTLSEVVAAVPDWVGGVGIFLLAGALALAVYFAASRMVLAMTVHRAQLLRSLFLRARRLLALVLVLAACSVAAQLPYFPDRIGAIFSKLMGVAAILLAGWAASIAVDVASEFYLRRYRLDTATNMEARKHVTQVRILKRACNVLVTLITVAAALMAFEPVRQFGVSLFASAGAAGLVVGLAARPVLSNLIAGIQLAITQPIRINDSVVVEGEWGTIDEITATYVVVRIWDLRRLVVPLSYFMEKPFQNWTRDSTQIIGAVTFQLDYTAPVDDIRAKLSEIAAASKLWDHNVVNLQVTDCHDVTITLRALVSASTGPAAWDLRCEVREKMLAYLRDELPECLPRRRQIVVDTPQQPARRPAMVR